MAQKQSSRKELENFLDHLNLPARPKLHVNGKDHPTAVVVVDFGAPLEPVSLATEVHQELKERIRRFTKELCSGRSKLQDEDIRVSSDNYLGLVVWSTIY